MVHGMSEVRAFAASRFVRHGRVWICYNTRRRKEMEQAMPYSIVEDKIAEISPQYRGELLAFIDFLIFRQRNSATANGADRKAAPRRRRKRAGRALGGFEDGFHMAPDFDAPLECFKEYM